jgi:protein-disulfide isomerase
LNLALFLATTLSAAAALWSAGLPGQASGVADVDPHKAYGSKNAPITMEVFSDFQCPACKQLNKTTNQLLIDNYVNTNKLYLIHRDFPLPMHAYSRVAAHYVRAAAQLGKGEQAEQVLFQNQEKWEQNGDVDGTVASVFSSAEMTKIRTLAKGTTLDHHHPLQGPDLPGGWRGELRRAAPVSRPAAIPALAAFSMERRRNSL